MPVYLKRSRVLSSSESGSDVGSKDRSSSESDSDVGSRDRSSSESDSDDDRMELQEGEVIEEKSVRFRTLGCYPLSGAVESEANTLIGIIEEMLVATSSERQGRAIDHDQSGSMELKKRQGYF